MLQWPGYLFEPFIFPIVWFYGKATVYSQGSRGGTFDRVEASDTRGPVFESSRWQLLLNNYFLLTVWLKDENKEKEAGTGPFKK